MFRRGAHDKHEEIRRSKTRERNESLFLERVDEFVGRQWRKGRRAREGERKRHYCNGNFGGILLNVRGIWMDGWREK